MAKKRVSVFFFRERHNFASARGMVVLSREARPCLLRNKKENVFSLFFPFARGMVLLSRERHGCDFARVTGVPLSKREKTHAPGSVFSSGFFCPVFFVKKSLSKPINIGSSFEDLDAMNPMMKMI